MGSPTAQISNPLPKNGKNRFQTGLTYLTIPLLTESLTEKRRLLGLRPAGSRPSAAPDRFAILPPGIPMMSRLRRHAFYWCVEFAEPSRSSIQRRVQRHRRRLAFQKSQADSAAIHSRGQGRRKRPDWRDFRAAQPHFERLEGFGTIERSMPLYGLPCRSHFWREIHAPFKRLHAFSNFPANSRSA
ncbi:hypothetical protein [Novosphingobium album (ex Liu et al. 2023)]|uniref:hypothetical protein n=1 Tax=Novosphingobium album (ex Liu et al. 2023) TaxID=3031130 RepID=UPI0023AF583E|nr:hypothetical protein [Novosphingobium album (ex Liu et al. 2023)]